MFDGFVPNDERLAVQRRATLMEMWYSLAPMGRLEALGALTADPVVLEFLGNLAASESQEAIALDMLRAEAVAKGLVHPKYIPTDAEVLLYFNDVTDVDDCDDDAEVLTLPYSRIMRTRYLGDSTFKLLGEAWGDGLGYDTVDEPFDVNDVVCLGAARIKGRHRSVSIEDVLRYHESVGVSIDDQAVVLTATSDEARLALVLSQLVVNNETILPHIGK